MALQDSNLSFLDTGSEYQLMKVTRDIPAFTAATLRKLTCSGFSDTLLNAYAIDGTDYMALLTAEKAVHIYSLRTSEILCSHKPSGAPLEYYVYDGTGDDFMIMYAMKSHISVITLTLADGVPMFVQRCTITLPESERVSAYALCSHYICIGYETKRTTSVHVYNLDNALQSSTITLDDCVVSLALLEHFPNAPAYLYKASAAQPPATPPVGGAGAGAGAGSGASAEGEAAVEAAVEAVPPADAGTDASASAPVDADASHCSRLPDEAYQATLVLVTKTRQRRATFSTFNISHSPTSLMRTTGGAPARNTDPPVITLLSDNDSFSGGRVAFISNRYLLVMRDDKTLLVDTRNNESDGAEPSATPGASIVNRVLRRLSTVAEAESVLAAALQIAASGPTSRALVACTANGQYIFSALDSPKTISMYVAGSHVATFKRPETLRGTRITNLILDTKTLSLRVLFDATGVQNPDAAGAFPLFVLDGHDTGPGQRIKRFLTQTQLMRIQPGWFLFDETRHGLMLAYPDHIDVYSCDEPDDVHYWTELPTFTDMHQRTIDGKIEIREAVGDWRFSPWAAEYSIESFSFFLRKDAPDDSVGNLTLTILVRGAGGRPDERIRIPLLLHKGVYICGSPSGQAGEHHTFGDNVSLTDLSLSRQDYDGTFFADAPSGHEGHEGPALPAAPRPKMVSRQAGTSFSEPSRLIATTSAVMQTDDAPRCTASAAVPAPAPAPEPIPGVDRSISMSMGRYQEYDSTVAAETKQRFIESHAEGWRDEYNRALQRAAPAPGPVSAKPSMVSENLSVIPAADSGSRAVGDSTNVDVSLFSQPLPAQMQLSFSGPPPAEPPSSGDKVVMAAALVGVGFVVGAFLLR